jgi:hypothetical protein
MRKSDGIFGPKPEIIDYQFVDRTRCRPNIIKILQHTFNIRLWNDILDYDVSVETLGPAPFFENSNSIGLIKPGLFAPISFPPFASGRPASKEILECAHLGILRNVFAAIYSRE